MASQGWDFSLGVRPIMPTSLDSLDSLAAALRSNREMEMRQAQFDAEQKEREKSRLAFEDQNKIGNRRADLAEERDQRKFELDTAHLRGEALKEAQRQYLTGGLPAVQAYVASQRIRNREGKWEGMGLDIRRDYANVAPDLQQPMQAPKPLSSGLRLDYENAPAELPADGQPEMTFAGPRAGMDRFYDRKTTFQPPSPDRDWQDDRDRRDAEQLHQQVSHHRAGHAQHVAHRRIGGVAERGVLHRPGRERERERARERDQRQAADFAQPAAKRFTHRVGEKS
mgnify:CR=1 FL=1